ncbi:hypothetical protein GE061_004578 [Apolygus lucorum]|uniref:Uncharacterized protein n=1 Tax=Apolygus lucorum TaxID=248454 RepID=A0A8S9WZ38_APOLU|nr:hypothetical protein GE061_004578 [Apolygus lucorum]
MTPGSMEATRDLGPRIKGGELNYVCDKATLEEIKVALEVVRDQRLTKLSYTTRVTPVIVEEDVDTLGKAKEAGSRALFSSYVLERTCKIIGERVQKSMEELDLEGMPVGRWMKALSLDLSATLRKLSLRHCRIGDEGCKSLRSSGLTTCLKELDLTGCVISNTGAGSLATLIASQSFRRVIDPDFRGVQKLVLSYNEIGNQGYSKLVDAILNDYWIKSVELRSCKITIPCDALRLALVNKEIEVFDLRDNPMPSKAVVEEVIRILKTRHPNEVSTYAWRE